jgi:O-antigen/teichoic acid export membrane protein
VVVPALCLGYVFQLFYYNFYVGLLVRNRTAHLAGVVVGSAAAGILLNFALIPAFGIRGAAWSMPASYAVLAGLCYLVARRGHPVAYEWGRLAKMGGLALLLFAAGSAIPPGAGWIGPAARAGARALFPIVLYAHRFFDDEELEKLRSLAGRFRRRRSTPDA